MIIKVLCLVYLLATLCCVCNRLDGFVKYGSQLSWYGSHIICGPDADTSMINI